VTCVFVCAVTVSSTGAKNQFKEMTTATSGVLARFPLLLPIRNPCELRGLCRRSYFGPRTFGGSITNVIEVDRVLNPGFPFSPLNVHFCVQPQAQRCLIPFTRGGDDLFGLRQGKLMTHFIGQTDLKPSSVTNGQNGAITPSLTPAMRAKVGDGGGEGPLNVHFCGPPSTKVLCSVHS